LNKLSREVLREDVCYIKLQSGALAKGNISVVRLIPKLGILVVIPCQGPGGGGTGSVYWAPSVTVMGLLFLELRDALFSPF